MILLDVFTFFGRLHPLFVHLPIGFLLLAIIFATLSKFTKFAPLKPAVPFAFLIGFLSAVIACVLGLMLSHSGDYDSPALSSHRAAGILLATTSGALYLLNTTAVKRLVFVRRPLAFVLSALTLILVILTGHRGATLTHGRDYITLQTLFEDERERPADISQAMIFEDIVHPILKQRCVQCHGREKRKGRLSVETLHSLLRGGKSGPAVVPGSLDESELFKRITLDPAHENFMPADGKPPVTQEETALIRWWIAKGLPLEGKKISELEGHDEIVTFASDYLGLETRPPGSKVVKMQQEHAHIPDTLNMRWVENLRNQGVVVRVMLHQPVMLDVTLPPRSGAKRKDVLKALEPVVQNIIWLNLSDNGFTEHELSILSDMTNLEKLRLEKNPVSDGISDHLTNLKHLEAVNLNETKITAACLDKLHDNEAIKRIYTWRTACDSIN